MHLTWRDLDTWHKDGGGRYYRSTTPFLTHAFPPPGETLEEMKDRLDLLEATRDTVLDYMANVAISINFYDSGLVPEFLEAATARLIAVTGEIVEARRAWVYAAKETSLWHPIMKYEDQMTANLEAKFPRSVDRLLNPVDYRFRQMARWGVDPLNAEVEPGSAAAAL